MESQIIQTSFGTIKTKDLNRIAKTGTFVNYKTGGMKLFYECIVALKAPCVYSNTCLEEFEDIKGVIRICKSKDRQHNGQNEKGQKDKQWSTKHTHTNKDQVKGTPQKNGGEFRCSGRVGSFCSTSDTRRVNPVTNPVISYE